MDSYIWIYGFIYGYMDIYIYMDIRIHIWVYGYIYIYIWHFNACDTIWPGASCLAFRGSTSGRSLGFPGTNKPQIQNSFAPRPRIIKRFLTLAKATMGSRSTAIFRDILELSESKVSEIPAVKTTNRKQLKR